MPLRGVAELPSTQVWLRCWMERGWTTVCRFGSGAGRLLLGVACGTVGQASPVLKLWKICTRSRMLQSKTPSLAARSVLALCEACTLVLPHEAPTSVLRAADMYSTAFPSDDGLRLPELSASLACVMRDGSVVITTDKFLVGPRFTFEALLPVEGSAGEAIHAFVWRVSGSQADSYDEELRTVLSDWMGEDACAQNPEACEALLAALGDGGDDDDEEE